MRRLEIRMVPIRIRYITGGSIGHPVFLQIAAKREPTSGLESLTCSLRVITQALQGFAEGCKYPLSKGIPLLCLAEGCTVLRSRWYQSGVNIVPLSAPHPRQGLVAISPNRASFPPCD